MVENYEHIYDECSVTYIMSLSSILRDIDLRNYDLLILTLALMDRWLWLNLIHFCTKHCFVGKFSFTIFAKSIYMYIYALIHGVTYYKYHNHI